MPLFPAFTTHAEFVLPYPFPLEHTAKEELETYIATGLLTGERFKVSDRSLLKAWLWLTAGLQPEHAPFCSQVLNAIKEKTHYLLENPQVDLMLTPALFGPAFSTAIADLQANLTNPTSKWALANDLSKVQLTSHYFKAWANYLITQETLAKPDYEALLESAKNATYHKKDTSQFHVVKLLSKFQKLPPGTITVLVHSPLVDNRSLHLISSGTIQWGLPHYEYLTPAPNVDTTTTLGYQLYQGLSLPPQEQHPYLKPWFTELTRLVDISIASKDTTAITSLFNSIYRDYESKLELQGTIKHLTTDVLKTFGIAYLPIDTYKIPFLYSISLNSTKGPGGSSFGSPVSHELTTLLLLPLSLPNPEDADLIAWFNKMADYKLTRTPKYSQSQNYDACPNTVCKLTRSTGFEYVSAFPGNKAEALKEEATKYLLKLHEVQLKPLERAPA